MKQTPNVPLRSWQSRSGKNRLRERPSGATVVLMDYQQLGQLTLSSTRDFTRPMVAVEIDPETRIIVGMELMFAATDPLAGETACET